MQLFVDLPIFGSSQWAIITKFREFSLLYTCLHTLHLIAEVAFQILNLLFDQCNVDGSLGHREPREDRFKDMNPSYGAVHMSWSSVPVMGYRPICRLTVCIWSSLHMHAEAADSEAMLWCSAHSLARFILRQKHYTCARFNFRIPISSNAVTTLTRLIPGQRWGCSTTHQYQVVKQLFPCFMFLGFSQCTMCSLSLLRYYRKYKWNF